MTFETLLKMAIETYAELTGRTFKDVAEECRDMTSQTAKNVSLLMFAAR